MVRLCLPGEETAKLSSIVVVPFCIPTSDEGENSHYSANTSCCQHLVFSVFWILNILIGSCILFLFAHFLMTNALTWLFSCTLSSECLLHWALHLFFCFSAGLLVFSWLSFESLCVFWIQILYQIGLLQIFCLSLWLIPSFSLHCFFRAEAFNFNRNEQQLFSFWIRVLVSHLITKSNVM